MEEELLHSEIAFSQPVINIGADGGNDIVLHGDAVADFHVMLHFDTDRWFLIPLDPAYPILVNGHGISPDGCEFTSGMQITISNYNLTVLLNGINADFQIRQDIRSVSAASAAAEESGESNILLSVSGPESIELEAGGTVEYEATVTNAGSLVANMQLQLQGIPSSWVQIIPPVLNLNEGRKGTFNIRISPPRDPSAAAGVYNLHFVAISPNYPRETGTANTAMTILPYSEYMVTGMTPRRLNLNRRRPSGLTDLVVTNNSNAASTFIVHANDDANELQFAYKHPDNSLVQGQDTVTVRSGDRVRVPVQVTANKRPLIGLTTSHHHYYTNVNPIDRPGDMQSVIGDVTVRPLINVFWLLLFLAVLAIIIIIAFQPYILRFDGLSGKRTDVIMNGDSLWIQWKASPFATKVTLDDGSGPKEVSREGSELLSPGSSSTYTLDSSNLLSRILGLSHERELTVMLIPRRPSIDLLSTDQNAVKEGESLKLSWAVTDATGKAVITENKQNTPLTEEKMSGNEQKTYDQDTLISLKAENGSSYDMKSLFVNILPNHIELKRFTAWVRPNGIAIPENSDVRRATRWSMIQAAVPASIQTIKPAAVNPLPAAQNNVLEIPDNFTSAGDTSQKMNPEQQSLSGQTGGRNNSYQVVDSQTGWEGLLVSPVQQTPTPTPVVAAQSSGGPVTVPTVSSQVPATSPEYSVSSREFSVKLAEVEEDPLSENGYRVISYFPEYVLQQGEQVMIEWEVEGVSQVKIENLSGDALASTGAEYIYPDKSVNLQLNAQVGSLQQSYSLPLRVAGQSDDGEGSGLNCELKANATTLAVPGSIMLTWTGGGNNRVQLLSSIKAEQEAKEAEKKKEDAAKAEGKEYKREQNQAMSGGIIGDYLEPAGFMRVDVNKQTTFVLNAYDGNNNVICSKSVEVKYTGGVDKQDITFKIKEVSDTNNVSQPEYSVGQQVQVTVDLSGYDKGSEPTGSFMVTDGYSTCSMTYPLMMCTLTAKHPGTMKLTAIYSGDDTYAKKTANGTMKVVNKIETVTDILSAYKQGTNLANAVTELTWDKSKANGHKPTGTITYTVGGGSCVLDMDAMRLDCSGYASKPDSYYHITQMELKDAAGKTIRAKYSGDVYFYPSQSEPFEFVTIDTDLLLSNQIKKADGTIDADISLTWIDTPPDGKTPSGVIKLTSGVSCSLDIASDTPEFTDGKCKGDVTVDVDGTYVIRNLDMGGEVANKLKAEYAGDGLFLPSASDELAFNKYDTEMVIELAYKPCDPMYANLVSELSWNKSAVPGDYAPTGTITFTAGSGEGCKLDLDKKVLSCGSELVRLKEDEKPVEELDPDGDKKGIIETLILRMLLDDKTADRVDAKYSGDTVFNPSSSVKVLFKSIDTNIAVVNPVKNDEKSEYLDLSSKLTWNPDDEIFTAISTYIGAAYANDLKPTGTITFTTNNTGSTCVWDIAKQQLTCNTSEVPVIDKENGSYRVLIKQMELSDTKADRIKAAYSGDAFFKPSESTFEKFNYSLKTTSISLSDLKLSGGKVNTKAALSWTEDALDSDGNPLPVSGTIKLSSGNAVCTLNITEDPPEFEDCTGDVTVVDDDPNDRTIIYEMTNLQFSDSLGTDIRADYSGDTYYMPSFSDTLTFGKFDTDLEILLAYKPYYKNYANVAVRLSWNKTDAPDFALDGTITFTIGTGKCELDLEKEDITCNADDLRIDRTEETVNPGTADEYLQGRYNILISRMLLDDTTSSTSDRVKAVYSGGAHFNGSSSKNTLFRTIDTKISVIDPAKPEGKPDRLNLISELTWNTVGLTDDILTYFGIDPKPTGTIKFSTYNPQVTGDVVTGTCIWDIDEQELRCNTPASTPPVVEKGSGIYRTIITQMLLADPASDRVRAEYSGDALFNSSVSTIEAFNHRAKTVIELSDLKSSSGKLNTTATVSWEEDVVDQAGNPRSVTGTIELTSGSAVCTLNITSAPPEFIGCTGDVTVVDDDPNDRIIVYEMKHIQFTTALGTEITAQYSGDDFFKASDSKPLSFDKHGSNLDIQFTYKPHNPDYANVLAVLTWDKTEVPDFAPEGTVVFTAGSGSCTLDLTAKTLTCDADVVEITAEEETQNPGTEDEYLEGRYEIRILKMLLEDKTADRIKAEYSGDAHFNKSASKNTRFSTLDTQTTFTDVIRVLENSVTMDTEISWDYDSHEMQSALLYFPEFYPRPEHVQPGGKITLSWLGEGGTPNGRTCTFDISKRVWEGDCSTASTPLYGYSYGYFQAEFYRLVYTDPNTQYVKAEYSGDGFFNKSASVIQKFPDPITTHLLLTNQDKTSQGLVDVMMNLTWEEKAPQYSILGGTIKLTSGNSTCTLDITSNPLKFTECEGQVALVSGGNYSDKYANYQVRNLKFPNGAGDDMKAEYSGNYLYKASSSNKVYFIRIDTALVINVAYKADDVKHASVTSTLSWDPEPAALKKPSGTVKFTVGSGSCTLDLATNKMDCDTNSISRTDPGGAYQMVIEKMLLTDQSADRVKAEYSGDAVFKPSTSTAVVFKTVSTEIQVIRAIKGDNNHASVRAQLSWDTSEDEGRKPMGSIKFVMGSGSCTLDIRTEKMTCEPASGTVNADHTIFDGWTMLMDDASADRVSAEYSGDGFFLPSVSTKVLFSTMDTETDITKAYKSASGYVILNSVLSWDKAAAGDRLPSGTLKITVGSKTLIYDIASKTLNSENGSVEADADREHFKFTDLLFADTANITEITVEYGGDGFFSSSRKTVPFTKIPTKTVILRGSATSFDGNNPNAFDPEFIAKVYVLDTPPKGAPPNGELNLVVKYAFGQSDLNCTFPMYRDGDCSTAYIYNTFSNDEHWITVRHKATVNINPASSVQLTYLGDSLFEPSSSGYFSFGGTTVTLNITKAVQISSGLKNLEFIFTPAPAGTLTISTNNGKSCVIKINNSSMLTQNTCGGTVHKDGDNWDVRGMGFDPVFAEQITIAFAPSSSIYHSPFAVSGFTKGDTDLTLEKIKYDYNDTVSMEAHIGFDKENMGYNNANWPTGDFVIKNGSYTCTIPLQYWNTGYSGDLAAISKDCGSGMIRISDEQESNSDHWDRTLIISALPIANPEQEFTAEYKGDCAYNPSNASGLIEDKLTVVITPEYSQEKKSISVNLESSSASSTYRPSGTVELTLNRSGLKCKVIISESANVTADQSCDWTVSLLAYSANMVRFEVKPGTIPSDDTSVTVKYFGDIHYYSAEKELKLRNYLVTLSAERIYTDGRAYFNVVNSSRKYPLYPDHLGSIDPYGYCNLSDSNRSDCRTPLHEFRITVRAELESGAPELPSGSIVRLEGGGINTQCTLAKLSTGVYSCQTPALSFNMTGMHTIDATYEGDDLFESASATIENLYAISIPANPTETITAFTAVVPAMNTIYASAGDTITVEANAINKSDPSTYVTNPEFFYYTYDDTLNKRLQTCFGRGPCELEITAETTHIFAEFVGNGTYAPSMAYKFVRIESNTGLNSSLSMQSPVSISVALEP